NSPGGSITAGMAIFDTMQFIKSDVSTICTGMAASMGAFLLAAGEKGKRFALPNSEVMIHQHLGGTQGQATDIEINEYRIKRKRYALSNIEVMIQQHIGGTQEHASDIEIHAKRIIEMREKINQILADRSGQPLEVIQADTDRDNFMSANKAVEYGLIDRVLER